MKSPIPGSSPENRAQKPETVLRMHADYVMPTYGRFPLVFSHGKGCRLWDTEGNEYLDMGGGIAVNCLGHAHPELTEVASSQSARMIHLSNLYYHETQGQLAYELVSRLERGKVFFCNSGAEANDGLYKLARKWGHHEGRFEILTTLNSFHGRTLAGIAATGQDKVKSGFSPLPSGFRHVPYNDLTAMKEALSPSTVAVLVEGIQGEGGIFPATQEYLLGLRRLCDQHRLLLMMDGVQCGHYRTGTFQSYQALIDPKWLQSGFRPDAISMAKSLGGGFPLGAFWASMEIADTLGPGSHGTTYGGGPLACSIALKVLEIIDRERLAKNALDRGAQLKDGLNRIKSDYPEMIRDVRGMGLMLGMVLDPNHPALLKPGKTPALNLVDRLHELRLLCIPAGVSVIRFLPALNIDSNSVDLALEKVAAALKSLLS